MPSTQRPTLMLLCVCRDEYFRMKVQWKSVTEEQEMRNSLLRGYRSLIGQKTEDQFIVVSVGCLWCWSWTWLCCFVTERDVSRTDRHNTFFSGNDNPGLTLLHDVLMTYCMFNFDLGRILLGLLANRSATHYNCVCVSVCVCVFCDNDKVT